MSAADYSELSTYRWYEKVLGGHSYAARAAKNPSGRRTTVFMHRQLLPSADNGQVVDHIDGDTLNNVRTNLRATDRRTNARNRTAAPRTSSSGVLGVTRHRHGWRARLVAGGKSVSLGTFATQGEAASARARGELEYWGENSAYYRDRQQ